MKKIVCRILPVLAIGLLIAAVSGVAIAQNPITADSIFQTNYYSNNNAAGVDGTFRIVNDGANGGTRGSFFSPSAGSLCAQIYVHSADQQLNECCGCLVTPNGLQTIDEKTQLTANTLTGRLAKDGVIEVIATRINSTASATSAAGTFGVAGAAATDNSPYCDPTIPGTFAIGLETWGTHIQNKVGTAYPVTETKSYQSTLSAGELVNEEGLCSFDVVNGSGSGVCDCGAFEN